MRLRTLAVLVLVGFCLLCGGLVIESGIVKTIHPGSHRSALPLLQTTETQAPSQPAPPTIAPAAPQPAPAKPNGFNAVGGPLERPTIGSTDPQSGFKYQLDLDSRGAAINTVTLSEFHERDSDNRQPLKFLSPVIVGGKEWMTMVDMPLNIFPSSKDPNAHIPVPLGKVSWKLLGKEIDNAGAQTASFEATIVDSNDRPRLRLTKTYRLARETYLLECRVEIDNLADSEERVQYNVAGPVGVEREVERQDTRKVVAAFAGRQGQIITEGRDRAAFLKKGNRFVPPKTGEGVRWIAAVNKYFAAIVVPVPDNNDYCCKWIESESGEVYNPGGNAAMGSADESIGVNLSTVKKTLKPVGQEGNSQSYAFQLYIGPKDKSTFDKNDLYRQLGFLNTIDFQGCCCPSNIINPLAFGILAIMKWMHGFWPHNYGIVIIILVFLMRLVLHPITKMSQVSMSKMSKLAPKAEEIKKKYANDKREQQKKMMELYREQGASPIMGFIPMFIQMPIWIALWSAINTSIDLRGAAFLPFWITDLSVPDALIKWPAITLPRGWKLASLNVLPILMGVAFYLQQKLMPTQAAAATNPQMAQQQKMMNVMMPLLFPLMLYNGPSGVNLYIMASTFAGVLEQQVIRKHIQEREEAEAKGLVPVTSKTGGKFKKKKPKPFYRFK